MTWTWSHSLANTLGEGGAPEDPSNLQRDYGDSDDDVRHYVVGQALYEPRFSAPGFHWVNGFELSSTTLYNSGYPINVTSGIDLNKDGNLNDRPLFVGLRNSLTGPSILEVDARLQRAFYRARTDFHLIASMEAENLLNSTNPACSTSGGCTGAVVSTAGAVDFGRITSARSARNVQFGVKGCFLRKGRVLKGIMHNLSNSISTRPLISRSLLTSASSWLPPAAAGRTRPPER